MTLVLEFFQVVSIENFAVFLHFRRAPTIVVEKVHDVLFVFPHATSIVESFQCVTKQFSLHCWNLKFPYLFIFSNGQILEPWNNHYATYSTKPGFSDVSWSGCFSASKSTESRIKNRGFIVFIASNIWCKSDPSTIGSTTPQPNLFEHFKAQKTHSEFQIF